jgi:hypothetical protein
MPFDHRAKEELIQRVKYEIRIIRAQLKTASLEDQIRINKEIAKREKELDDALNDR